MPGPRGRCLVGGVPGRGVPGPGGAWSWGCLVPGVPGGCLVGGVPGPGGGAWSGGCLVPGGAFQHALRQTVIKP